MRCPGDKKMTRTSGRDPQVADTLDLEQVASQNIITVLLANLGSGELSGDENNSSPVVRTRRFHC